VYRGLAPAGTPPNGTIGCVDVEDPGTSFADAAVPSPGAFFYYLVSARNTCGESVPGTTSSGVPRTPAVACGSAGADADGDGVPDLADHCPLHADPTLADGDGDFSGDVCDNCPQRANPAQSDLDRDTIGDACDACTDGDGDGFGDPGFPASTCALDNCPQAFNPSQTDSDADLLGDACDACPLDPENGCT
jgi:hypothetical protein